MNNRVDPITFARQRRQIADDYEQTMWQALRNRQRCNKKFRREHPVGIYTVDFCCAEAKLVVEIDGKSHEAESAKQSDLARDKWLKEQGYRVIRFTCHQVEHEIDSVLKQIDAILEREIPSPPTPLPKNSDKA